MKHTPWTVIYFIAGGALLALRLVIGRHYYSGASRGIGRTALDGAFTILLGTGEFYVPALFAFTRRLDFANYQLPVWTGVVGTIVFAAGIWLILRAQVDLGKSWSPSVEFRPGQQLVTSGVYRRIRHPMYAGFFIWAFAQPLLVQNWVAGFGMLVVFVPMFLYRAPREERLMLEQFGNEFREYAKRTGRIIPKGP